MSIGIIHVLNDADSAVYNWSTELYIRDTSM